MCKFEELQSGDKHFFQLTPLCQGGFCLKTVFGKHEKTRIPHQCFKFH